MKRMMSIVLALAVIAGAFYVGKQVLSNNDQSTRSNPVVETEEPANPAPKADPTEEPAATEVAFVLVTPVTNATATPAPKAATKAPAAKKTTPAKKAETTKAPAKKATAVPEFKSETEMSRTEFLARATKKVGESRAFVVVPQEGAKDIQSVTLYGDAPTVRISATSGKPMVWSPDIKVGKYQASCSKVTVTWCEKHHGLTNVSRRHGDVCDAVWTAEFDSAAVTWTYKGQRYWGFQICLHGKGGSGAKPTAKPTKTPKPTATTKPPKPTATPKPTAEPLTLASPKPSAKPTGTPAHSHGQDEDEEEEQTGTPAHSHGQDEESGEEKPTPTAPSAESGKPQSFAAQVAQEQETATYTTTTTDDKPPVHSTGSSTEHAQAEEPAPTQETGTTSTHSHSGGADEGEAEQATPTRPPLSL